MIPCQSHPHQRRSHVTLDLDNGLHDHNDDKKARIVEREKRTAGVPTRRQLTPSELFGSAMSRRCGAMQTANTRTDWIRCRNIEIHIGYGHRDNHADHPSVRPAAQQRPFSAPPRGGCRARPDTRVVMLA